MNKYLIILLSVLLSNLTFSFAQNDGDNISIGKYRVIHSTVLNENRTLLIHLPSDYKKSDKTYPVIYMLYGNHTTTYFAETVSVLDSYGSEGMIPEMILVGIMNTDRYRDLLPRDSKGNKTGIYNFLQFFKTELVTFVEDNYRTKDFRALIGPQAGANFSMYAMFNEPDLFNAFFINNPFRWTGGRDQIMKTAEDYFTKNKSFKKFMFITHDNSDKQEMIGNEYIKKFEELVKNKNPETFQLSLNYLPDNKDFISPLGIKEGLKEYFKDYLFPENIQIENLKTITDYYKSLSKKYGFEIDISGVFLVIEADKLFAQGKKEEYQEVLYYIIKNKANPENAYWRLGELSLKAWELEKTKEYLEKMMEIIGSDNGMVKSRYNNVINIIEKSATYDLEQKINEKGFNAIKENYNIPFKIKNKYFDENELIESGNRYIQKNRINEAIYIFNVCRSNFPKSDKAYQGLGDSYYKKADFKEALIHFKKSVSFNKKNTYSKEMINKIKSKKI